MTEKRLTVQLSFGRRELTALAAVALVALGAGTLSTESLTLTTYYPSPYGVYSQMRTTDNTFLAYTNGTVAIGTNNPPNGYKLYDSANSFTAGKATMGSDAEVDGNLSVNGPYNNIYATGISVTGKNIHVQGNEAPTWLRLGDAWGYSGVYAESGDVVIGSQSGRVRIGPDDSGYVAAGCHMVGYSFGTSTSCPSNWSVYSFADGGGVMFNSPGGGAIGMPLSGTMLCCKMQQN